LSNAFRNELSVLKKLFRLGTVQQNLQRLDEIYNYTEARWREYVEQLPDGLVRYLLIAEAPPWSETPAPPQYVLCPASRPRTVMRALRKAFSVPEQFDTSTALKEFARQGLLIVDFVPFAMKYSRISRSGAKYKYLMRLASQSYLQKKLDLTSLSWSPHVRVAFSLQRNALAVIEGLSGELKLGGKRVAISAKVIAVNGAGYPDGDRLRSIWNLQKLAPKAKSS
jgi:hypothetical protein